MNPKIALFLSASLTAFVLATLAGVAGKVTSAPTATASASEQAVVQEVPATATLEQPTEMPVPTVQPPLGPEEAAALAAESINRQDVYSVESSTYQGVDAYKVVFSFGDVVYIGLDRQVLTTTKLQPVVVNVAPAKPLKKHNNNNNNVGQAPSAPSAPSGEGEQEGEHEGEHD